MSDEFGLLDVLDLFPDEWASEAWLEEIRWPDGPVCPDCGSYGVSDVKNRIPMPYRCRDCRHHFSVRKGTVMQSSKLPYQTWGLAIYIVATSPKGVSSIKLHHDLKVKQHTAWFLSHRIRAAFPDGLKSLEGPVEVDETYIGGIDKWRHAHKKGRHEKSIVVGVKDRESGQVAARVIAKTDSPTLKGFVRGQVQAGAPVYTDEHAGYRGLANHAAVNHTRQEYVRGKVHTNGVESFWTQVKRSLHGTYHTVSRQHLQKYVNEFTGKFNIRHLPTLMRMVLIVRGMDNQTLTYRDLIGR